MGITVQKDDVISVFTRSITAVTVRVTVSIKAANSSIVTGLTIDVVTNSDRTSKSGSKVVETDGVIESAATEVVIGSTPDGPGELFIGAQILRNGSIVQQLLGGYRYLFNNPVYPGPIYGPLDGPGRVYYIATADPGAGAEVAAQPVPTNAVWKVRSYSVSLVQGAVQTPLPTLRLRAAAATVVAQIPITSTAISAASTARLTWALGLQQTSFTAVVGDEFHTAPLPDVKLHAADDIGTLTDGIGANTDYGPAQIEVEEWISAA